MNDTGGLLVVRAERAADGATLATSWRLLPTYPEPRRASSHARKNRPHASAPETHCARGLVFQAIRGRGENEADDAARRETCDMRPDIRTLAAEAKKD